MLSNFSGRPWPVKHEVHRWKGGSPLPCDGSELIELYGKEFIAICGSARVPELVQELEVRGVIAAFPLDQSIPEFVTGQEMWGILGASYGQWCGWWGKNQEKVEFCPAGEGSAYGKATRWHREAVSKIRAVMPGKLDRPVYHLTTLQAFWEHIKAGVEEITRDWTPAKKPEKKQPVKLVGWPIGVPKDYDALYREHRPYVERILNHYYKPSSTQSIEDVKGHIWLKLCEAQVIEKFVAKARSRKLPAQLTAGEAVEYLGITWDQWMNLMRRDLGWLQPVEGNIFSTSASFTAKQIRNVEESGQFPIKDAIPASDMSKVFRGYLKQVIHNHFANYCRTRVRRFILDTPLAEGARVRGDGTVGSALEGDQTSWEDCLEDYGELSPEACLDRPEVDSLDELDEDLSEQIARINKAVPGHRDDVINLIAEGSTLREAIQQVRAQVQEKLKVHS